MGLPPARRKRAEVQPMRPQRSRFPVRAILDKLINSDRFDKAIRPRVSPPLTRNSVGSGNATFCATLTPVLYGQVYLEFNRAP